MIRSKSLLFFVSSSCCLAETEKYYVSSTLGRFCVFSVFSCLTPKNLSRILYGRDGGRVPIRVVEDDAFTDVPQGDGLLEIVFSL